MGIELHKYKSSPAVSATQALPLKKGITDLLNRDLHLFKRKLNDKQREAFYSELSTLLISGVDIRSSLDLLENEQPKKEHKKCISQLKDNVVKGMSLSTAME